MAAPLSMESSRKKFAAVDMVYYTSALNWKPWQTGFAHAAKCFGLHHVLTSAAVKEKMDNGVGVHGRSTFSTAAKARGEG